MNPKTKEPLLKILKIIWIVFGVFLGFFLFNAIIKAHDFSGNGFGTIGGAIAVGVLLAIAIFAVAAYVIITLIILLVRWIIKKRRRKK